MAKAYDFRIQLAEGEAYEFQLDVIFTKWFVITTATREQQRMGIDRLFLNAKTGKTYAVEYKADSKAGQSGNAFVETISVDVTGKPGWAISSQADMLIYLVTNPQTIYCIWMADLRRKLSRWQADYRTVSARNDGYKTFGVLVPLMEFEEIATTVM